ncbi:hypothetical protein [Flavobacterium sp. I3-2]|uniref:RipA family octameric membrane protein n=1 Tax=Flavobacterium sp. I3-2 TaxID=2748319 RepID=UPI0015ABFB4F|nr:hypothetical protein [Flavobacterium sp. I3-2]
MPKTRKKRNEQRKYEQYKLLIQARNFHYDNYNKWMTYFYVAMAAFFVGYYTLIASEIKNNLNFEIHALLSVGYIISLLWFISSKGYYYWNINFIKLINSFEKNILKIKESERVYFVFANKKEENKPFSPINGANFSTSKITILFSYIITVFWGVLLLNKITNDKDFIVTILVVLSSSFITLIISSLLSIILKSNIENTPDLELNEKSEIKNLKF